MNTLEIKHFRLIKAIAECGTMTRAAERLFLTQSALSQQLKDIEEKLGVGLFARNRKNMTPSSVGRQLLETGEMVLAAVDEAEREIVRRAAGLVGELRVGLQCVYCYRWVPQVLGRLQRRYPGLTVELTTVTDIEEDLRQGRFDLVISGRIEPRAGYDVRPLFSDQLLAIMHRDHALAEKPFLRLEDFASDDFIAPGDKPGNRFYQGALKARGIEPKRYMNVGAPQAVVEMVAAGFGLAIFPRWAIRDTLETRPILARPITPRGLPVTWHAIFREEGAIDHFRQEFLDGIAGANLPLGGCHLLADDIGIEPVVNS